MPVQTLPMYQSDEHRAHRQAGRLGGFAVLERHGIDHYQRIGHVGGVETQRLHGQGLAVEARLRGGITNRTRHDDEHFVAIGRQGGEATSARHGTALHRRLGTLVRDRYGRQHYARLSAMSAATLHYLPDLRLWRLRRGLSNAALSHRSGVSRAAIRGFEELDRGARSATVEKLADALGIELTELSP